MAREAKYTYSGVIPTVSEEKGRNIKDGSEVDVRVLQFHDPETLEIHCFPMGHELAEQVGKLLQGEKPSPVEISRTMPDLKGDPTAALRGEPQRR